MRNWSGASGNYKVMAHHDSLNVVSLKAHRPHIICHYGDSQSKQICLCDSGINVNSGVLAYKMKRDILTTKIFYFNCHHFHLGFFFIFILKYTLKLAPENTAGV